MKYFLLFAILGTLTPFVESALPRVRLVDGNRVCWYWFTREMLDCEELSSGPPYSSKSYNLKRYIKKFGKPFQLTQKKRRVMVHGLIWEQENYSWTLRASENQELELSETQFYGVYSNLK